MPRRRVPTPYHPKAPSAPSPLKTRLELLTYAFSRLPPRQLPFLAAYAYCIIYAAEKGWVDQKSLGKAGASIVGVLSMVTGLLLSYRFSSAISKWDEGKQVWAQVRITIRDGIRLVSIPTSVASASQAVSPASTSVDLGGEVDIEIKTATGTDPKSSIQETDSETLGVISSSETPSSSSSSSASSPSGKGRAKGKSAAKEEKEDERENYVVERADELAGLMVGFAFALQHHLHGTRPLPQPPLCDLLPTGYLSSLKRTEARVRFAEAHAGPSNPSPSAKSIPASNSALGSGSGSSLTSSALFDDHLRPGLRRRGTGPPTQEERESAGEDEWELSNLRDKAEEAVTRLAEAVASSGLSTGEGGSDLELRQQLSQLNIPRKDQENYPQRLDIGKKGLVYRSTSYPPSGPGLGLGSGVGMGMKPKSNLHNPYPSNLPLALLKLTEAYVVGLAEVDASGGGWSEAKRERGLGIVKALSANLGEAERLSSNPPPLPLTLHLTHLVMIYLAALPCSLLCVVSGWALVLITLVAGWCLLGLEALIGEVGGVFGSSENHHPLPMFTQQILNESLDVSPSFMRSYRARLVSRLGEDEQEVVELDGKGRRGGEEWLPAFS
ncbi:hypothetical protein IAT40_007069 [Kwoniella sp. CBS 6097]